jgi:hypothetical protein
VDMTLSIATVVVGLIIGSVAFAAEGTLRIVVFTVGLLLLLGGVVALGTNRRR